MFTPKQQRSFDAAKAAAQQGSPADFVPVQRGTLMSSAQVWRRGYYMVASWNTDTSLALADDGTLMLVEGAVAREVNAPRSVLQRMFDAYKVVAYPPLAPIIVDEPAPAEPAAALDAGMKVIYNRNHHEKRGDNGPVEARVFRVGPQKVEIVFDLDGAPARRWVLPSKLTLAVN